MDPGDKTPSTVFIAWLDAPGAELAAVLSKWLMASLPVLRVMKGPDVRASGDWQTALPRALNGASAALVCVVGNQAEEPWTHLQLGACLRALGPRKPVVPVLLDVSDGTFANTPLGLFQAVRPNESDFRRLLRDLIRAAGGGIGEGDRAHPDFSFPELLDELDAVPGPSAKAYQIVLVLPDRVLPIPNAAPFRDEEWSSVVRRTTAVQSLPGVQLAPFTASDLECLDLSREEWIRPPRLVSRLTSRNIALVHHEVATRYQRHAKAVAKHAKLQVAKYDAVRFRAV